MTEKKSLEDVKNLLKVKAGKALNNRYLLVLIGIVAFSLAIRLEYAFFQGMWVDESIHGRLAQELPKHLLEYSLPDKGGAMTKRPPVYNYLLAFSNMLLGGIVGTDTAVRIVSPVMGAVGVLSTYVLGREVKNREVGLAAAALVSVNAVFWFISERVLMGATLTALFTTTILAFHYGLEDKKYSKYAVWAWGPLIALTALTKQPGYTLGPIIVLYFLYRKREDLKDYFLTDKDLKDSGLYDLLTERNYYIALGLFALTMLPWMVRNMAVCGFPLCSFQTALNIVSSTTGNLDVQGPLYFIFSMPSLISVPATALVLLNASKGVFQSFDRDGDLTVKKSVVAVLLVGGAYMMRMELVPLALLTSVAMFVRTDGEKLLWLSAGLGIGIMSVNATKVPRYVVFAVPALLTIAAVSLWDLSSWMKKLLPEDGAAAKVTVPVILLILTAPILALTFTDGLNRVSRTGFGALEPAGEWIEGNTDEDARIYATSPQVRYWAYPRYPVASAGRAPDNETGFRQFLRDENISYVMVDVYERTQPQWMNLGIPPYRVYPGLVRDIRSGRISPQEATEMFAPVPDYLTPLQRFGETSIPLTQQTQPEVIIYGVNRTAL